MMKLPAATVLYVIAGVVSGAPSASPVLSAVSDPARFSWDIPQGSLGTESTFYTVSPASVTVFLVTGTGIFIPTANYTDRLVYQGNIAARNVTFTLSNIQTSDAGTYTCRGGGASSVTQNCGQKLVVLGKPITPGRPVSTTPVYNQQVTLTCSSTSTTVPADHGLTLTYTWQRDNTDITVTSPGSPYTFTVSSRDSHNYSCRARESQGLESEWSQVYNMEPQYGPYQNSLTPSTSSYTVTEHQALPSITCSALCKPGCTYRWLHSGTTVSSGAILQGQADRSNTGSYRCQPSNTHGSSDSVTVRVEVQYPAEVVLETQRSATCRPHRVYVGQQNVQLTCRVTAANPAVTSYTWTHNSSVIQSARGAVFTISSISRTSGGSYTCQGNNSLGGSTSSPVTLEIQYGPSVSVAASTQTVTEGQTMSVTCSVDSKPVATVTWTRKDGSSFTPQTGSTLTISNIQRSQAGTYVCTATNTLSPCVGTSLVRSDSVEMTVDVQYPANVSMFTANSLSGTLTVNESDTVTLRCQINSNPSSVIKLLNGTEELTRADNSMTSEYRLESADCRQRGNYSCSATNNIGAPVSQRVELLVKCYPRLDETVPPQLKYASRLGGNVNVSVSVLSYPLPTFTWSRTTSTSQDLTASSSPVSDISVTSRLHLTNLQQQDFGDYSLTVDNDVGGSVTYTLSIVSEGPPQTPTQFRDLDNATTSSVWLSWLPGFNGGNPQTFLLEYRQFATRTWTVYNSYDDTSKMMVVKVTGLTPGDIYIFRLLAKNEYDGSSKHVFVETRTAGDPPDQHKLEAPYASTGVITGTAVGTFLLTLLIEGIVLVLLYRKGYRFGNILKGNASRESTRNPETVEMDNREYSSLDQNNVPAQYSNLEEESDKQQYSQLKIYENTKADAAADTSTYEGMTETPPVTYESIRASPYQNTGAHSQGPGHIHE